MIYLLTKNVQFVETQSTSPFIFCNATGVEHMLARHNPNLLPIPLVNEVRLATRAL